MELIFEKWNDILEHVRKEHEVTDVSFETWLAPLKVHSIKNDTVRILVPIGDQMITYLNSKYKMPIFVAIAEFTGKKYDVEFITQKQADEEDTEISSKEAVKSAQGVSNLTLEKANINGKYTFDTFVVGSNNKFAHAASLAVAETP